jgi:hypothetical protein
MTDFVPFVQAYQFEDLSWDLTPPEGGFVQPGTLDLTAFSSAQHYPNGFIKSGCVLGKITATGLYGPYLDAASDGRTTATGLLRASVPVTHLIGGAARTKMGVAQLVHGVVSVGALPYTVGNAALGGYIDADCQANLPLIYWAA